MGMGVGMSMTLSPAFQRLLGQQSGTSEQRRLQRLLSGTSAAASSSIVAALAFYLQHEAAQGRRINTQGVCKRRRCRAGAPSVNAHSAQSRVRRWRSKAARTLRLTA